MPLHAQLAAERAHGQRVEAVAVHYLKRRGDHHLAREPLAARRHAPDMPDGGAGPVPRVGA
jgi:hypothetical protein